MLVCRPITLVGWEDLHQFCTEGLKKMPRGGGAYILTGFSDDV